MVISGSEITIKFMKTFEGYEYLQKFFSINFSVLFKVIFFLSRVLLSSKKFKFNFPYYYTFDLKLSEVFETDMAVPHLPPLKPFDISLSFEDLHSKVL